MSTLCHFCKKEIEDGAIKCVHCDSYQNWRKYIQFSNTVLSLLVALISVTALATPIIIKACKADKTDVRIKIINKQFDLSRGYGKLSFKGDLLISNIGNKPGIVSNPKLFINAKINKKKKDSPDSTLLIDDTYTVNLFADRK